MTGWWDHLYPPHRSGEARTRRPCGCFIDPVVFGHQVLHLTVRAVMDARAEVPR